MILVHGLKYPWAAIRAEASRLSLASRTTIAGLLSLAELFCSPLGFTQGSDPDAVNQSAGEIAIRRLSEGNYAAASQNLRAALSLTPDDSILNVAAGAVGVCTGDWDTARTAFQHAVQGDAHDGLAHYGLGLAQLGRGDRSAALESFDRSESSGGDPATILLARRYTQWLGGAHISLEGAALPEQLVPGQSALEAMQAAREGNWREASSRLQGALAQIPGDPIVEPGGALLNFDPAHPLSTGASRLPSGSLTVAPDHGALTGSVEISPEGSLVGVHFVSYELDGQPIGIVNVRPFHYAWDTRRAKNGQHTLTVILHDAAVNELARTDRKIRIVNPEPADSPDGARVRGRERAALWLALALRPGRCSGSYMLGMACRAQGDTAAAQLWFARCIAIQPDYRDARRQWAACGGAARSAGPALWGGLTTEKVVALTFDDGPKPGVTEPLLDVLRQERVPATFFVIGRHVMEYPELTKQIAGTGMEIANHSYTHPNLTRLADIEVAREIMQTQAAIQTVTGRAPRFLRPPGGNWNAKVAQTARSWGLTPCMWTVDVYGSEVIGAQQVADAVLSQVRPGSIILMHNGKVSTLQALPTIIRALRSRGFAFATIETLEQRLGTARAAARSQAADVRQRSE